MSLEMSLLRMLLFASFLRGCWRRLFPEENPVVTRSHVHGSLDVHSLPKDQENFMNTVTNAMYRRKSENCIITRVPLNETNFHVNLYKNDYNQCLSKHARHQRFKNRTFCVLFAIVFVISLQAATSIVFARDVSIFAFKKDTSRFERYPVGFLMENTENEWSFKHNIFRFDTDREKPALSEHKKSSLFEYYSASLSCPSVSQYHKENMNSTSLKSKLNFSSLWNTHSSIHHTDAWLYPLFTLNAFLSSKDANSTLHEEMKFEIRRLQSFNGSPVKASPMRLARSGFYATGNGDETQCYSCKVTYRNWKLMDKPDIVHRQISPACQHLNRQDSTNMPIYPDHEDENVTEVCGIVGVYPLTQSSQTASENVNEAVVGATASAYPSGRSGEEAAATILPNLDISKALYPQYRDQHSRLDTYREWRFPHVQNPRILSEAGLYFAGYRDCVRCFYCGIGLRTWEKEDDPWVVHARMRSSCDYVRCMKGEEFVIAALAVGAHSDPPQTPMAASAERSQQDRVAELITKAGEMGFSRAETERVVEELVQDQHRLYGSREITRQNDTSPIQLETLIEKLLITQGESMTNQSRWMEENHISSLPGHILSSSSATAVSNPAADTGERASGYPQRRGTAGVLDSSDSSPSTVTSGTTQYGEEKLKVINETEQTDEKERKKTQEKSWQNNTAPELNFLSPSEQRQLEEENQSLRDESTCKVCMDNTSCIVFLPCGHLVTCAECAPALRKCPVCRAVIRGTVRAYSA